MGGGKAGTFLPEKYCVSARKKLLIYPYTNMQLTETVYTVDKQQIIVSFQSALPDSPHPIISLAKKPDFGHFISLDQMNSYVLFFKNRKKQYFFIFGCCLLPRKIQRWPEKYYFVRLRGAPPPARTPMLILKGYFKSNTDNQLRVFSLVFTFRIPIIGYLIQVPHPNFFPRDALQCKARYCDCMSSVSPSVCLSVCDVGRLGPHKLEVLETNGQLAQRLHSSQPKGYPSTPRGTWGNFGETRVGMGKSGVLQHKSGNYCRRPNPSKFR